MIYSGDKIGDSGYNAFQWHGLSPRGSGIPTNSATADTPVRLAESTGLSWPREMRRFLW